MHSASMIFWAQVMESAEHIWRGNWCWNTHKYICTFWSFGLFLLVQIQKTRWFRHYWILWYVTPPDSRPVVWPFTFRLTVYSPKPQQSVRQWRPFAKDNEANAHKASDQFRQICDKLLLKQKENIVLSQLCSFHIRTTKSNFLPPHVWENITLRNVQLRTTQMMKI